MAVRIIAGEHRGRRIAAPKGTETRPTSDFVRETAFNLIGPVDGAAVLDLYAGSGALGLEALSRGAASCVFVDSSREACRSIGANLDELGLKATVLCQDAVRALASDRGPYDLILADPPYTFTAYDRLAPHIARLLAAGRPRRPPDRRPRPSPPSRAWQSVPPAATAPHALPCSSRDHRHLPRLLRSRHERPRRRDPARREDLRPRRRRRRRQPAAQDAPCSRSRSASTSSATPSPRSRTSRSTSSRSSSSTSPAAGRRG